MREKRSPRQLEAIWKEKDMASGRTVDAMVMIMRTNGCVWAKSGGCTMCGYKDASLTGVTEDDLMAQVDQAVSRYDGEPFVKIYTSGSFLDDNEIPPSVRERIFSEFKDAERILFESRPEFVTNDSVAMLPKTVTIALGLESSDDDILKISINKGFTSGDSRRAGETIKNAGLMVRTYLLLKPPYLTESAAMDDAIASVKFADAFSDEISINPVNVQRGTLAERLWKKGDYRPPWVWSLIEVLKICAPETRARLMSSPSGGGTQRGVHNCDECDRNALDAVEKYSFSQNVKDLDVKCECINSWKRYMEKENMLGSAMDMDRALDKDLAIKGMK